MKVVTSFNITAKEPIMKNRDGLENNDNWETPEWLYNELNKEFNFDYDPCPLNTDFDGLKTEWGQSNFINPPYNRIDKPKFIKKAFDEWKKGKTCVLLIPSATGTKQFHELMLPNAEIRFLKGRVAFKGYNSKGEYTTNNKGKHDSMVVIFSHNRGDSKLTKILRVVCEINGVEIAAVKGRRRFRELITARREYCYLACKLTQLSERNPGGNSLSRIGNEINQSHSNVLCHNKKTESWLNIPSYGIVEKLEMIEGKL